MSFKRIFMLLSAVVMILSLSVMAVSCSGTGDDETNTTCTVHKDADANGKCDVCGADQPVCTAHKDENGDKKCDKCKAAFEPDCTEHVDNNNNTVCDICGEMFEAGAEEKTFNVSVVDDDGNTMYNVELEFIKNGVVEYAAAIYSTGVTSVTLEHGTYEISVVSSTLPDGYLAYVQTVTVGADTEAVIVEVYNKIPDGTAEKPFTFEMNDSVIEIPANSEYFYTVYHPSEKILTLNGDGFVLVTLDAVGNGEYIETEYAPETGVVKFQFEKQEDSNTHALIKLVNTTSSAITVNANLITELGSQGNPIIIESLGEAIENTVDEGQLIYYRWTADVDTTITITLATSGIKLSAVSGETKTEQIILNSSTMTGSLLVKAGEELILDISVEAEVHTDEDGDCICDDCGENACVDSDGDAICDECQKPITIITKTANFTVSK